MAEEVSKDAPTDEQEKKDTGLPDLAALLSAYDGAPQKADVEAWKQQFGEVYCSGFSETELFVWRPISRREYVQLQKKLRTPPQDPKEEQLTEFDFEEMVVKTALLWCSDEKVLLSKAGSVGTLSEQVMQNSNFMPAAMASQFVVRL